MRNLITGLAVLALAACGAGNGADVAAPAIEVGNAFVMVPLEGRDMTMAGADIAVRGGEVTLVDVQAAFADRIELHTIAMEDGMMRMRQVEGYEIADGETLQLKRGADHLMVFGVRDLVPGEAYTMNLVFERPDGSQEVVEVEARARALGE